jgi:hypothetical protein
MLLWLATSACDADKDPPELPIPLEDTATPAPTTPPPPPPSARVLSVGPIAAGLDVAVTVRPALPGEGLVVGWSAAGPGPGPCPPSLRGACFALADATVLDPVTTDFSGHVTATARIDADGPVRVQAFIVTPLGDVVSTDILERPTYDPAEVLVGDATPDDLPGYRALTGSLRLEASDVTALSLPDLEQLGGDLVLWESPALDEVSLPALRWIGGDLSLYDDVALADLHVPALERIGGTLSVNRMPAIADLDAFAALAVIGGDLYVYHDLALGRVDGLDALARIGGALILWELPALHTVSLPQLHGVGAKLDLFEDDALTTLSLPALEELGAYELHHCDAMADVGRFDALTAVRGEVALRYDAGLRGLSGFASVATMGTLTVSFSDQLSTLADLEALTELSIGLDLLRLPALGAVDLPRLERAAAVSVRSNEGLVDLGLPALTEVADLGVLDNPALPGCAVEALIARVSPATVACSGNLPDSCTTHCDAGAP